MDFHEAWEKALSETEIIRSRVSALQTFNDTHVPYTLLSASGINPGDTVVRTGEVVVKKPSLVLPPNMPQFDGFEFQNDTPADDNAMINFLLVRGISLPSMRYDNRTYSLDVYEGELEKAVGHYQDDMMRKENVTAGLIAGPEDVWQMSLLIFICSQVAKNAQADIQRLIDEYRNKKGE